MPLPNMDKLRESATGAIEMASGKLKETKLGEKLKETKFKLMKTSESEAEFVEEEASQASETSRLEELSAFCPKLTWQQVSQSCTGAILGAFSLLDLFDMG